MIRRAAAPILLCLFPSFLLAAPVAPPDPDTWNVHLRYSIVAFGNERLRQYAEMTRALQAAGFARASDDIPAENEPEDARATRMRGTVPARGVARLLGQRHIRTLLLYPKGTKLPDKGRIRVEVQLVSGLIPDTQRQLFRQTARVLAHDAGLIEGVGYDHRGATRLVGSVPVNRLEALLEDIRTLPSARDEGAPLRTIAPVRLVVVRPDWPVPAARPAAPTVPAAQDKLSLDLRALLGGEEARKPDRLEVVLASEPSASWAWRRDLERSGVIVEGRLGPLVTVRGIPGEAVAKLAALPEVVGVRLPRRPTAVSIEEPLRWELLRDSGPVHLFALPHQGRGARIAIVASDFTGWHDLGKKGIQLVDLTASRNRDLLPDPFPAAGKEPALGTQVAVQLRKALPQAELTLLRIDPAAPHQLQELAWAINGSGRTSLALADRLGELVADRAALDRRKEALLEERALALGDPREEEKPLARRKAYQAQQEAFDRDLEAYRGRFERYQRMQADLDALRGIRTVATTLVWEDGHPLPAGGGLSLYFNERPFRAATWFRPARPAGRVWSGLFRDGDGNGVMEFVPPGTRLPAGVWTPEIHFLAWRSSAGKEGRDLPANSVVKLTVRWREAHDPLPIRLGEDPYRQPLARLKLVVVRQLDPLGKERPADDLEVVAESAGTPLRLEQSASAATYEAEIVFRVPRSGRYGVRLEGRMPESTLAPGEVRLPGMRKFGEVHPRLTVFTRNGAGQAVWSTWPNGSDTEPASRR